MGVERGELGLGSIDSGLQSLVCGGVGLLCCQSLCLGDESRQLACDLVRVIADVQQAEMIHCEPVASGIYSLEANLQLVAGKYEF